jgi:hypothetical protein
MDRNRLNASGYIDNTAYEAVGNVAREEKHRRDNAASELIREVKALIRGRGFEVIGRIGIKDKETGREYK